MIPETLTSLINLGSAGAVIAVVILFLRYLAKREADWQDFFTALKSANEADMQRVSDSLEKVVIGINYIQTDLRTHDSKVDDRVQSIVRNARRNDTRPVKS